MEKIIIAVSIELYERDPRSWGVMQDSHHLCVLSICSRLKYLQPNLLLDLQPTGVRSPS